LDSHEFRVERIERFGKDARVGEHGHEVVVAFPARDDVQMRCSTTPAPAISFFATISCIAAPIPGSTGSSAKMDRAKQSAEKSVR